MRRIYEMLFILLNYWSIKLLGLIILKHLSIVILHFIGYHKVCAKVSALGFDRVVVESIGKFISTLIFNKSIVLYIFKTYW